ncbi:MAG: hypothetical protein IJZ58_00530 [Oscillospiraceae bacterium]|nr:hypothetical protein [Oscillospiraceae bacterium]
MKDEELVNEMLKSIVKNEIRAGYPVLTEDHFFFQQVVEFMQDKRIWLGTVSELIFDMNCKTVYANTAAKLLHKYGKTVLKKKGVSVKFIRTNRKRLVELKK